jgi:hypothetical protein
VYIGDKEYLSVKNNFFKWTIDIPFNSFDNPVSQEAIDDPAFKSFLMIKEVKTDFDILNDLTILNDLSLPDDLLIIDDSKAFKEFPNTSFHPEIEPSRQIVTPVNIKIFSTLIYKLCIEQDIQIQGIPLD